MSKWLVATQGSWFKVRLCVSRTMYFAECLKCHHFKLATAFGGSFSWSSWIHRALFLPVPLERGQVANEGRKGGRREGGSGGGFGNGVFRGQKKVAHLRNARGRARAVGGRERGVGVWFAGGQ